MTQTDKGAMHEVGADVGQPRLVEMTRAEWQKTHTSFKCRLADGTRAVMRLDPKTGGSMLVPVRIVP